MNRENIEKFLEEAAAIEAEDAKKAGTIGYMARVLTQATLPHREAEGNQFIRRNGAFELSITALGASGLPFGSIPRLLLSWMTTEAVRTRSPLLELGPSLSQFMTQLGLAVQGGKRGDITRFRNQTMRLFSSAISCRYLDDEMALGESFAIARRFALWWDPKRPEQGALWKSTVTLSTDFFDEIVKRPVPIDMRALHVLKRSPLALDIYCWLTHRLSYLGKETVIPWQALQWQFGANYADSPRGLLDFKRAFLRQLRAVHVLYPQAKIEDGDSGLILKPSPPHVPMKSTIEALTSKRRNAASLADNPLEQAMRPLLEGAPLPFALRPETYEKAKQVAPGFDVYALEQHWLEWIAKKTEPPKNPDGAFIGFCRAKAKKSV